MKTCKKSDCTNPQFGGGYCKFHQYLREKTKKRIPSRTKKRFNEEKEYHTEALKFFSEKGVKQENFCIFCGKKVKFFAGLHHWKGRKGVLLMDKRWWSVVHNECHMFYHNSSVANMTKRWGLSFWNRLESFDKDLADKIQNRAKKSSLQSKFDK
jgi:hypothetical protein